MAELLIANCVMKERMKQYKTAGVRWQVVWYVLLATGCLRDMLRADG